MKKEGGNADLIVRADGVDKTYQSGRLRVEALRDVSFHVRSGEMVAVMGPSGCGKTTLLNCLSGLDDVDAGTVRVEGRDLTRLRDDDKARHRARRMGFIFQAFNLLPVLSAAENVELPLLVAGVRPRKARRRAAQALESVGLGHRVGHMPSELSGGEQQRVAVARSLVNAPAIVWADEPTGNLDSENSAAVMELLRGLNRSLGQTYVIVTHSPEVAAVCHRTVWMRNGRIDQPTAPGGRERRLRPARR